MEDSIQPSINPEGDEHPRLCSFCGEAEKSVETLIVGPGVNICNECVDQCVQILAVARDQQPGSGPS